MKVIDRFTCSFEELELVLDSLCSLWGKVESVGEIRVLQVNGSEAKVPKIDRSLRPQWLNAAEEGQEKERSLSKRAKTPVNMCQFFLEKNRFYLRPA